MAGRIVHVNDHVDGAVYIGRAVPRKGLRASPLSNPYRIGIDGDREEVIEKFREMAAYRLQAQGGFAICLALARGKPLSCWCRHDGETEPACHGDVLLELLAQYTDDELRAMGTSYG